MRRAAVLMVLLASLPASGRNMPAERAEIAAALSWAPPAPVAAAPVTLTASDGTGLRLRSVEADSVVTDPLAYTELTLTFENPEDRVREGRFEITLPDNAAISRFAMQIDGRWQEGEILEKQRARQVYEDFLHRSQDPALLESDAGNQFRARIFPIPAGGVKVLKIAYSQELTGAEEPWRLPLQGLPQLDELNVTVSLSQPGGANTIYTVSERAVVPRADLALQLDTPQVNVGLRGGNLAVARVRPSLDLPAADLDGLTVLVDTSASRALGYADKLAHLSAVMGAVADQEGNIPVQVVAFDQELSPVYTGNIRGFGRAEAALAARQALGASDLGGALRTLQPSHSRLLLVTDGIFTAGDTEADALHAAIEGLSVERLDVLVDSGARDEDALAGLVTAGLPADGLVLDADQPTAEIARRLGTATRSGITVSVPGAEWVWPQTLDGVQDGDDQLVYAWMADDRPMQVHLDGAWVRSPLRFSAVASPLLERAAAKANIDRLTALHSAAAPEQKAHLRDQIVSMSVEQRVLSDFTAMLVLETEEDYARYDISRSSLSDILTIEGHQLRRIARADWVVPAQPVAVSAPDEEQLERKLQQSGPFSALSGADDAPADTAEAVADGWSEPVYSESPPMMAMEEEEIEVEEDFAINVGSLELADRTAGERRQERRDSDERSRPQKADPWEGRFGEIMQRLERGQVAAARADAERWRAESPGDVLALVALGEAMEAAGEHRAAARAYGSIIDLFPSRADLRRMAGQRLERLGPSGAMLAADTFRVAVEQRPDHPASHRLYAWSLVRLGRHQAAAEAMAAGLSQPYPGGRFEGVRQIMLEELGIIGAAWRAESPGEAAQIEALLSAHGATIDELASTRLVLHWETDANDVDLHTYDRGRGHAWYSSRSMPSGGQLYADVTNGYGPECFTVEGAGAFPYTVQAHYYSRGPMGYGMGTLQVIAHDGRGRLAFSHHPYVIMKDGATVDLATVERPPLALR